MREATKIVSVDACPGDPLRPSATPIYQTATFEQESALEFGRYDYSRSGNPTRTVLERHLAGLDGAARAFAFASGLAAITGVTRLLEPGDEILANDDLYGGTYRLFSRLLEKRGVRVRYADLAEPGAAAREISARTRLVYCESLSNPLLRACDLRELARAAHARDARLAVDATALSPYLQRPLELGADIVVHSATKFLCGHSDVMAGAVCVRDAALAEQIGFVQNAEGAGLSPFDAFLVIRGVKTLALRLDRQQQNARRVADALRRLPGVTGVLFPGLDDHPTAGVHRAQASGPGAVVCFRTGDAGFSRRIVEGLTLFPISVSFGGVNSTVSLPCRMSHASIPEDVRRARRFPEDLVRLSIGIEDAQDLIDDLARSISDASAAGTGAPAERSGAHVA